jgi:hypothetical protein
MTTPTLTHEGVTYAIPPALTRRERRTVQRLAGHRSLRATEEALERKDGLTRAALVSVILARYGVSRTVEQLDRAVVELNG